MTILGLLLKVQEQEKPFAAFTYALTPAMEKATPVNWKILVTEDVQSQHIRCHELQPGDSLAQLVRQYRSAYALAVVVINMEDSYTLAPAFLKEMERDNYPVLVLTKSDGKELLSHLDRYEDVYVYARVDVESMVDVVTQQPRLHPPQPSRSSSGALGSSSEEARGPGKVCLVWLCV